MKVVRLIIFCLNLDATVIPGKVKSQVSLRIVPDQDLNTIAKSLCCHLKSAFQSFQSPNELEVSELCYLPFSRSNFDSLPG